MDWSTVTASVLEALVPIAVAVLIALIGMAFTWLKEHVKSLKQSAALAALEAGIESEVTAAGTGIVNPLKASGKWTADMGAQIKDSVSAKVLAKLPDAARNVLGGLTTDVGALIGSKIEQQVAANQASGVQAKVQALANPPSASPSPASGTQVSA